MIFSTKKIILFYLFTCFIVMSCNPLENDKATQQKDDTKDTLVLVQPDKANSDRNNDESSFEAESYHNQEVIATYQSASMYAAATHYYFETEIGEEILVVEGLDENKQVKLPKNMLEKLELGEEPPDANPEFIGNIFKLYFNDKGRVYKVIPAK